jgi:haloalkane dehalogenase
MTDSHESATVRVDGRSLHYLSAGSGPAVLLLHGWPTSALLWRRVIGPIARTNRVLALDLPGFGRSDKPLDVRYDFAFYERMIEGFLQEVGAPDIGLAVHDLGGPVGLYWAVRHMPRVRSLALLNTLVYPVPSLAVLGFLLATWVPGVRSYLTSSRGLEMTLRIGLGRASRATPEAIQIMREPFTTPAARAALLKSAQGLRPGGFIEIARKLPSFRGPVRIVYGTRDRILPDVAKTMARVARDLPQARTTRLEGCGHFLQEEKGAEVGELLAEFFANEPSTSRG